MKTHRSIITVPIMIAVLFVQACGNNFATELRIILAASGPLIQSLPLPAAVKNGLITDFTDLASGAATFSDDLRACAASKPCKLGAVEKYEAVFERVIARGRFGTSPKLQTIEGIARGIIASAKIYYGGRTASMAGTTQTVTEADMKAQMASLRKAMQP